MFTFLEIWILILPALSFALISLFQKYISNRMAGLIGTTSLFISLLLSLQVFAVYDIIKGFSGQEEAELPYMAVTHYNWTWLNFSDTLSIKMGILLDPISIMMLIVITLISFLVNLYSIGYMKDDVGQKRYFGFLSLFSFSMLGLVVATNIFQMYIFWELVGVSSYLLIGHYYDKPSAVSAAKKAFIVTRFADLGFLIGILLLSYHTGTFDFEILTDSSNPVYENTGAISFMGLSTITWALILIFMGGAGKSAMFPLHIWLPDAMEGPTPVSALIHAATMVVAGVYLVARMFNIFVDVAPDAIAVVAFVGAFTSLFAAVIACTQEDIKRVLAFSTMSQLGYMMLALGVSSDVNGHLGFTASMFHLFTHAIFKALLFLGAGAVIHAVHSNVMKDMGGLRRKMPITAFTFLIACLAISGIPPFAGFFSKDEILAAAYESNLMYYYVELFVAGLTAFYMFRLYFKIFWYKEMKTDESIHDAPRIMAIPLLILAVLSIVAGFVPFGEYVSFNGYPLQVEFHWSVAITSVVVALTGILIAFLLFKKDKQKTKPQSALYRLVENKFYFDELYLFVTHNVIFALISKPVAWFDRHVVDGAMNGVAWVTNKVSSGIKGSQSGQLQHYLIAFVIGIVSLFLITIYLKA